MKHSLFTQLTHDCFACHESNGRNAGCNKSPSLQMSLVCLCVYSLLSIFPRNARDDQGDIVQPRSSVYQCALPLTQADVCLLLPLNTPTCDARFRHTRASFQLLPLVFSCFYLILGAFRSAKFSTPIDVISYSLSVKVALKYAVYCERRPQSACYCI